MKKGPEGAELYLLLVVNIPQEQHVLNKKIVVGVDLGINVPAYVATNCTEERKAIGDRDHFLNTRTAFSRRFHSFQRLKGTAGGKGRKNKLEPLERLREKERNWVHTQNHLISRDVINFALQARAATIQMEDLSGYGKDEEGNVKPENKFLQSKWSYFELQSMIKYKAAKCGIKVNLIAPAYTSQTCSWCGQMGSRESTSFVCQNPGCEQYGKDIHADYNAARNIARSNKIVKNE
jgi:IS605 OrfB family transposase